MWFGVNMRKVLIVIAVVLLVAVVATKIYDATVKSGMAPVNAEVSRLRNIAEKAVPLLKAYKMKHGRYPCHLQDLLGSEAVEFDSPPPVTASYRATSNDYYLYVRNSNATAVILQGADHATISWEPCFAGGSCPPGEFAPYCCDVEGYPKCGVLK